MSDFRLAFPLALVLLILPLGLLIHQLAGYSPKTNYPTLVYSDTRLLDGLHSGWRVRLRWLPDTLRWLAWILLVVSLARPQGGTQVDVLRGQGIDIVLVLDISTSMGALDFEPQNRLETAKTVISDFISGREFDRIGLVVFARGAFQQAPLTLDYPVILRLLDEVELASELRPIDGRRLDGTAIGLGIASAANMLRAGDAPSKVIILLTDGDNNAGLDPLQAANAADALGFKVYTIGMGRIGLVEIPTRDGELITIESDLNETSLQMIAASAEGLYFRAEDTAGLQEIYSRIDQLERSEVERIIFTRWNDYAFSYIALALLLLLIERLLRHTSFQTIP